MIRPPSSQINLNKLYDFILAMLKTASADSRLTLAATQPLTAPLNALSAFTPFPNLFTGLAPTEIKDELITEFLYLEQLGTRNLIDTILNAIAPNNHTLIEYPQDSFVLNDDTSLLNVSSQTAEDFKKRTPPITVSKKYLSLSFGIIVQVTQSVTDADITSMKEILEVITPPYLFLQVVKI